MRLEMSAEGYRLALDSRREADLVRDMFIEADYALSRVSELEYRLRLGVDRNQFQQILNGWGAGELSKEISILEAELIRACWSEVLDFLSSNEFKMRTGYDKPEASSVFREFMQDRRKATIRRQWG